MFFILNKNGKITRPANLQQMTGEKIPGDLSGWNQFSTDPNAILRFSYNLLSERSTTLYHTHPPVSAAIEKHTQYAIGSGLVFRSQPDWEILKMTKVQAKDWGMQLQKLIHYAFLMLNFYEKQGVLFRTAHILGDSLLLFDRKEPVEGLPFDLIETGGDQIDCDKDSETAAGDQVRLGIKTDKFLRRKGIYFVNNSTPVPFTDENGFQNVIQFFERKMARQLRGYPLAYRIISAAKNNDRMWDALLGRMAIEASIVGVEKADAGDVNIQASRLAEEMKEFQNADTGTNPGNTATIKSDGNIKQLGSGNFFSIAKDGSFEFMDMKAPSNNFKMAQDEYYNLIGMATNTPPEVVKSLYGGSYTAHMGAINDFEKTFMKERGSFIYIVAEPVVRELTKFFIVSGLLPIPNEQFFNNAIMQRAALAGKWIGPVPGVINPTDQANANQTKVTNGFMLRSDAAMQSGYDWDNFIEEYAQEEEAFRSASPAQKAATIQKDIESDKENSGSDDSTDDTNNDNNNDNTDENNNPDDKGDQE
jgi:capsid protein